MRVIVVFFFLFIFSFGFSQKKYPQDYFSNPLKIPTVLSGTFGELRSNHFHSGIDIKTQGKEGIPIYAPADGYVSRIRVGQYGFGKALYVRHPNGYTTVYAHLQKYSVDIQKYVKENQYRKEKYAIGNLFPKPDKFPVKKGEVIGYTGNTGSSLGPHLHYEIRETKSEHIINPLHFGMDVEDTKTPTVKKIVAYPIGSNSRVSNVHQKTVIPFKNLGNGNFTAERITAIGYVGFGISVHDKLNGATNKNGIYSLEMKVNGNRYYYHDVETFSFSESKYINLLIDYKHYAKFKSRVQKTFKHPASKLSMYEDLFDNGKVYIEEGQNYNIELIAKDFKGNTSTVKIPVKGVQANSIFKEKDTTNYKIKAKEFTKFTEQNVTVAFPKNTFYEDCYLDILVDNDTAQVHRPTIPLDKRYTLTFNTNHLSASQKKQVYIANVTKEKYPYYVSTKRKHNKVFTNQKALGTYTLKFDDKSPTIRAVNFKNNQWISALSELKVRIKDKETGIKSWRATIDDDWVLMEYNQRTGVLTYDFSDKKLTSGKHTFKIVVADNVGNTEVKTLVFFRKSN